MQDAAERKMEFMLGAFADPIFKGDFPASVKQRITFLPQITPQLVSSSLGFLTSLPLLLK